MARTTEDCKRGKKCEGEEIWVQKADLVLVASNRWCPAEIIGWICDVTWTVPGGLYNCTLLSVAHECFFIGQKHKDE